MEDTLTKLLIASPPPENSTELKDHESTLDSLQETYDNLVDLLSTRISEAERSSGQYRQEPPRFAKAVSVLKPEELCIDTPPASLEVWIRSFE